MLASAHGHDNTKNHKLIFIHNSIKQCASARNKKKQKLVQEPEDTKKHKTKVIQHEKETMCISMKQTCSPQTYQS
jgi:hypothetical protein